LSQDGIGSKRRPKAIFSLNPIPNPVTAVKPSTRENSLSNPAGLNGIQNIKIPPPNQARFKKKFDGDLGKTAVWFLTIGIYRRDPSTQFSNPELWRTLTIESTLICLSLKA
jgi:hypothetical protein